MPLAGGTMTFADQTVNVASGALVAVNADQPAQTTTLEARGQWLSLLLKHIGPVLEATVDPGTGVYRRLRQRYMVYAKGNRLMKADLASNGLPVPTPFSTLTTNDICSGSYINFNVATDYADASKSYVLLVSPDGPAGSCFGPGSLYRALRLDMGPNDTPLTVPNPLAAIRDATGAITGFIVRAGNQVQRTDANFANAVNGFVAPSGLVSLGVFGSSAPGVWVYSDSNDLFAVDLAAPVPAATPLGVPVSLFVIGHQNVVVDGGSMYVAYGPNVVRINENRTATPIGAAATPIQELGVTPSRVIFRANNVLGSIPKAGGAALTLVANPGSFDIFNALNRNGAIDPTSGSSNNWQHVFLTGGENVYYVTQNGTPPNRYAVRVIASDGTGAQVTQGARIVSWTEGPAVPWAGNTTAHTIYLAENEGSGLFAGSPIRAYDAATRAQRFAVGTFPAALSIQVQPDQVQPILFGEPGLIRALTGSLTGMLGYNLFVFRSDQAGLTQATQF